MLPLIVSTSLLTSLLLLASLLVSKVLRRRADRYYTSVYFAAFLFLTLGQVVHLDTPSRWLDLGSHVVFAVQQFALMAYVAGQARLKVSRMWFLALAVAYLLVDQLLPGRSVLFTMLFAAVTHLYAALMLGYARPQNVADRYLIAILVAWAAGWAYLVPAASDYVGLYEYMAGNVWIAALQPVYIGSVGVFWLAALVLKLKLVSDPHQAIDMVQQAATSKADRQASSIVGDGPFAVAVVDIDDLARVNEDYGRDAGDQVLQQLATTLQETLRGSDMLIRYTPEAFVVVMPQTDIFGAQLVADRLRRHIEVQRWGHKNQIDLTVSMGLAVRRSGELFDDVVARGIVAMRVAKSEGKNQIGRADQEQDIPSLELTQAE